MTRIRLTRIIAFNWYGFRTIIEVNGLTLLCGETGTGKSALLDLIQFVMSAGAVKFNKAAAGESNARDLVGYCLGDTNTRQRDGQSRYLRRSGATIAALEFSWPASAGKETRRETWGIRVQFESPSAQPSYVRFFVPTRMERADLCDEKGALLSEELFRSRVKRELGGDAGFITHKGFQEEMGVARHLYFDDEQMRKTLPKAIAFELDSDYQTFIREFILEPNPPDVTSTRRSLRALREAENRVKQLYDQQQKLERIATEDRLYQEGFREAALFGYVRHALDDAEAEEKQARVDGSLQLLRSQNAENQQRLDLAVSEKDVAKQNLDAVKLVAGRDDPQFETFERLMREKEAEAKEAEGLTARNKTVRMFLRDRQQAWERWLRQATNARWPIAVPPAKIAILGDADTNQALAGVAALVAEFHRLWTETKEYLQPKQASIATLKDRQTRLENQLKHLQAGRTAATPLLDKLRSAGIKAHTLARVVEVQPSGERWWGVLESLLGDDRNAVLVDATRDWVSAQELWLKLPKPEPLIHPDEIPAQTVTPGSLATLLETAHPVARRYLDWRFGRLLAVGDAAEVVKHFYAASPEGAVREAPVLRQIVPEKDFSLGDEGLRRLRVAAEAELAKVSAELRELEQERSDLNRWLDRGKTERLDQDDRPDGAGDVCRLPEMRAKLQRTVDALKLVETAERKDRLRQLHELESKVTAADQTIGSLKGPLSEFQSRQSALEEELASVRSERQAAGITLQEQRAKLPAGFLETEIAERVAAAKNSPGTWKQRRQQAEGAAGSWQSKANDARNRRLQERTSLVEMYRDEFGEFDVKDDSNARFDQRLGQIREHEVTRFESLAAERRTDWEKRLQEDVLDRLRERLKEAKQTIDDFRRILRREIGGYRYVLQQTRDGHHRAMWKLLDQSGDGLRAGDPLLDWKLQEEIEQAKRELMEAIDQPEDRRVAALLDYRNYHRYDLHMVPVGHSDDSEGAISLQERGSNLSGGEGQAPFFVAMLAAFHRVYDRGQRGLQTNLGLVVMDEAFSKLSAGHIADCLALAEGFGLQLILAFPMDRLGTMVQHADSIIQCRVQRTADAKGAPTGIVNDVIYWKRDEAMAEFVP